MYAHLRRDGALDGEASSSFGRFDGEGEGDEVGEGAEGLSRVELEPDGEEGVGFDVDFAVDGCEGKAVGAGERELTNERDGSAERLTFFWTERNGRRRL